jgi:hypothetical protein
MGYGFFRPTKGKLALFVIVAAAMFYMPVIPTYVMPFVKVDMSHEAPHWQLASAVDTTNIMNSADAYTYSFGIFAGTEAGVLNMIYILAAGYILACLLLYGYHRIHG